MDICRGCFDDLPWNRHCCPVCALPLEPAVSALTPCGRCQREPPPYRQLFAPLVYREPVDRLIQGFKFQERLNHGRLLAQLFIWALQEMSVEPATLLPVPLHPRRLRQRGFNQALVLARYLKKQYPQLNLDYRKLARTLDTQPQAGLKAKVRRRNLKQAFTMTGDFSSRQVIVLDDVVTTATTVNEVCRTLKRNRVSRDRIQVWALARTPAASDQ